VNLLREGLDLPEVSLVAILDADKEGFLRNEKSLTQTAGRAARNVKGLVIFYADKVTESMRRTMEETSRRRTKQMEYNEKHGIIPTTVVKSTLDVLAQTSVLEIKTYDPAHPYVQPETKSLAAEDSILYEGSVEEMSVAELEKQARALKKHMEKAAKDMDFMEAAKLRDDLIALQDLIEKKKK
jgi:excinuclease ABC subunit B